MRFVIATLGGNSVAAYGRIVNMKTLVRNPGFTIVELLIVIVVLGILAAITVTTYRGMQERAINNSMANGLVQYMKGLSFVLQTEGEYGVLEACLDGTTTCWTRDISATNSAILSTKLRKHIPSLPQLPKKFIFTYNDTWGGYYIAYHQQGSGPCMDIVGRTIASGDYMVGSSTRLCRVDIPDAP